MDKLRPTMTVKELEEDLRACGVPTSQGKVKAMIQQGKYAEFAKSCEMTDTEYEIYRKPYEEFKIRMGLKKGA